MVLSREIEIEHVLAEIEAFICDSEIYPFFLSHRNRFKSDAALIMDSYEQAEILEIGSIPCHFTATLSLLGYPVVGIDIRPERGKAMIDRFALRVERCDIERQYLPFSDQSFNYVLCNEVFEHLRIDPLFALSEINRVMKNAGTLLFTTPNLYAIQQIARFVTGRGFGDPIAEFAKLRHFGSMGHIREYSHAEIKRFLQINNFEITSAAFKHYHYPKTNRGRLAYLLFHLLPARFRTFQVILAKKRGPSMGLRPLN